MTPRLTLLLLLSVTIACDTDPKGDDSGADTDTDPPTDDTGTDTDPSLLDGDGDGHTPADGDCDDTSAAIYPGATEVCDGIDNNCDGTTDEGVTTLFYADTDADGFGDPDSFVSACAAPADHVADDQDCDDSRSDVSPAALEVCDPDNTDEDCNSLSNDDDPGVTDQTLFYEDADADGFGNPDRALAACEAPAGHVADDQDCNDDHSDPSNPNARCWNGTWTGTITLAFTVPDLAVNDRCTGTVSLPIDLSGSPMINGTGSCTASSVGALSFLITGDISSTNTITGSIDTSYFVAPWSGVISDVGLSGIASGTDSSSGLTINYTLSMTASP